VRRAVGHNGDDLVTLLARRPRHVAQRLAVVETHREQLANRQPFELQLGAHERHGTDLAGDIDAVRDGFGHGADYTKAGPRCRVAPMPDGKSRLEALCVERGLKMTEQRRTIARVLSDASDHPDVEAVHRRATAIDPNISLATVYRTVRLFEEAGILARHDFGQVGQGRARYEEASDEHHDHLIDIQSGTVVEFHDQEIEELQRRIAERLGYRLVGHRLELYGTPLGAKSGRAK